MRFCFPCAPAWRRAFSQRRSSALVASRSRARATSVGRLSSVVLQALLGVALISACSPAYNWRTVSDAAEGYAIDLPAKPTVDERQVAIAGLTLPMHVRAAETQHAVFAIAVVDLPRDDAALGQTVADDLRRALARNVSASPVEHAVQVPLATGAAVPGVDIVATGAAGDAHQRRTIHAWIAVRGRHVYQAAIIAARVPPQDQSDQFFGSLKLD